MGLQFSTPIIAAPGLHVDYAQREGQGRELRDAEELIRSLIDTLPVMIWMSGSDKLCTYFNRSKLKFIGRSLDSVLGTGWTEAVHPEDLGRCWELYTKAFDLREPIDMEFRFRRYDGEYRWLQSSGVPRFNANGSFLGYIGSATDITEHKLAEQSLSKVGQASILAQEEERANVAQELHRHIDGLISVSIDLDRCEQNALGSVVDIRREIREIRKEVNEIVNGILDLWHRLHTWKLEYLGLAKAAESFCRELADTQKVKIDFHCEGVPKELPKEIALCLYRVLQESLQNATRHSTSPRYEVSLNGKWNEIQLTVRDWGCGFELAVAMNGPGLGLVYMKEMLKVVGGELVVDSQPQRGTRVQSRVPLKQIGEDVRPLPIQ